MVAGMFCVRVYAGMCVCVHIEGIQQSKRCRMVCVCVCVCVLVSSYVPVCVHTQTMLLLTLAVSLPHSKHSLAHEHSQ